VPTYGLVADPVRNVVYVSATAIAPVNPSSIVALAADTGTVLWATPVTPEPGALAISDDGTKLYVAPVTGSVVRRLNIASRAVDLTFDDGTGAPVFDMAVMPGNPRTVALALSTHGAAVYDDAVMRPSVLEGWISTNAVAFAGPALLLGFNTHTTSPLFRTATVNAGGLTLADSIADVFRDFIGDFVYDRGLAFGWDGNVFDVNARRVIGTLDLPGKVAVDPTGTGVYVASYTNFTQYPLVFGEFDRGTLARKRTLTLTLDGIPDVIVRATDGTLAVSALMEQPARTVERVLLLVHPAAW
jgi:DNA-binding beta-propeller fold protein YncE